jgi:predicted DNA-binding transcriptional regulator AlpA
MINKTPDAPRRIARMPKAVEILGLSRSTILRREQVDINFPRRVRLGPHSTGWFEDELVGWIESRPLVLANNETEAV